MNDARSVWEPALTHHQHLALTQPGVVSWTYHQLHHSVQTLCALLRTSGLRSQDSIAVIMPDGAAGLLTQLGVIEYCACAPLNPSLTETELHNDLLELGVSALICDPAYNLGRQLAEQLNLILIHASLNGPTCEWNAQNVTHTAASRKNNDGAAILLHTSATTGRRKVVPLTLKNLAASCANTSRSLRLTENDCLLLMARHFHAQGILSALAQWSAGGIVVVANSPDPQAFVLCLLEQQVTWYTCGPTLHQAILIELRKQPLPPSNALRLIRSGGNTLPAALKAELQQHLLVPVLDMYGLSETGAVAADHLDAPGWRTVGPEICIMSPQGQALPCGEEGEIVVSGPSVMSGYWNDQEANRAAFWSSDAKCWFRTGDLGSLDTSGHLTMSGREKEIINRGGQKIKPAEIDQVLSRHPAVQAVAAFGVPHPTLGEDVACAVVLKPGMPASEADLRTFARQALARYKVPGRVHLVPSIPCGATGKPQRLLLRERLGARPLAEPGAGAYSSAQPMSRSERAIAELWASRLHCSQITLGDDFFQLGGDSLEAVSMLSEVEVLLEKPLPPGATERFFETPTLHLLSTLLLAPAEPHSEAPQRKPPSHALRLYSLLSDGPGIHAFLFPADDEEGWYFRLLSRYLGKHRPMSILRPENGLYPPGPFLVEQAAAQAVALIRQSQPHGPYLLGGFCLGGVIAYETARLLEIEGERVVLTLFDVPMPGTPHPLYAVKTYVGALWERVRAARQGKQSWRRVAAFPLLQLRRCLWFALCQTKSRHRRMPESPLVRWLRRQAEHSYLPLYRPPPAKLPILHFVMSDRRDVLRTTSIAAWSHHATAATKIIPLSGSHHTLFRESNLPLMTQAINDWVSSHAVAETSAKEAMPAHQAPMPHPALDG